MSKRNMLAGCGLVLLFLCSCRLNQDPKPASFIQYRNDREVVPLLASSAPAAVNVVILGDGYEKKDLQVGGEFDTKAKGVVNYLFTTAPFSSYKEYFNIYEVCAESKDNKPGNNVPNENTAFNTALLTATNLFSANNKKCSDYARLAVSNGTINLIILLVNNAENASYLDNQLDIVPAGDKYLSVLLHKIGHTFADLGEESANTGDQPVLKNAVAGYPNLDVTTDPAKVKWASYLKLKTYSPVVGIYEGGYFVSKGVYRPEQNSVMRDPYTYSNFNAPCREAIAKRICKITGVTFNLNDFLDRDKNSIQPRIVPVTTPPVSPVKPNPIPGPWAPDVSY
ncbi:hypothetical protein HQ865_22400 [Mucilaginibacter mali]|uniref:IgA Peptidase M64 n=1 Tax=Mucilaginibacter mali TaxID=2740462 RepID=A0A7D4TRY2_9SPHI|nr:M64 family metallopeptidase [Mucilaginibacter mali]QKJ32394.1 hypothetical protein HQ865_22400 [Mucilaginibacter mali]